MWLKFGLSQSSTPATGSRAGARLDRLIIGPQVANLPHNNPDSLENARPDQEFGTRSARLAGLRHGGFFVHFCAFWAKFEGTCWGRVGLGIGFFHLFSDALAALWVGVCARGCTNASPGVATRHTGVCAPPGHQAFCAGFGLWAQVEKTSRYETGPAWPACAAARLANEKTKLTPW